MRKILFISFSILLVIILGTASVLYQIGKTAKLERNTELKHVPDDIEKALYTASFAANSHNSQAWKIEIHPKKGELSIFLDDTRTLNVVDPDNRELYISLGCYIESLQTSFTAYGYTVSIEDFIPNSQNRWQVASISYEKSQTSSGIDEETIALIQKRHTDKRKFQKIPIDSEVISSLLEKYNSLYYYAFDSEEYDFLKEETIATSKEQHQDPDFLEEQSQWLRFSNRESEESKDGITGDMLGLNVITKALYYLTSNHKNATEATFVKQSLATIEGQAGSAGGFLILSGQDSISDWIALGRKTQAIWYDCVKNDIAVQPISALIEVPASREKTAQYLSSSEPIQMLLRLGYVKNYGENTSPRRDLKDYITVIEDKKISVYCISY